LWPAGDPPAVPIAVPNPVLVSGVDYDRLWEQLVDVVDDDFRIQNEQQGSAVTGGRIDTRPQGGATWLEPQRGDSVGRYNRWESTLQTIRRAAHVNVLPAEGGFLLEVQVEKELEDLPQPERATAGASVFRGNNGPAIPLNPERRHPTSAPNAGWIPLGRDVALEQRIIMKVLTRLGMSVPTVAY